MNTSKQQSEFSFDGFGINGPLPYRERLATFNKSGFTGEEIQKAGNLFAAAPDLLTALENLASSYETCLASDTSRKTWEGVARINWGVIKNAIARAKGEL